METLKKFIVVLIAAFCSAVSFAQLSVKSFTADPMNLTASVHQRLDLNGVPCAVVVVSLPVEGVVFSGNVIGEPVFKANEYWVYLTDGTKMFKIQCPGTESLMVDLVDAEGKVGVSSKTTYNLKLDGYSHLLPSRQANNSSGRNYLILSITPKQGITVSVDGIPQSVEDDGMTMTLLTYGTHTYQVEAEGYLPVNGRADIGPNGSTTVSVNLESIKAVLSINCPTTGASVKVNGKDIGIIPLTTELAPGRYHIEVSKNGYTPYSQTIELKKKEVKTIEIPALTEIFGTLDIIYKPIGSEIYIDGKVFGTSPSTFNNIGVGKHNVMITHDGCQPFTTTVYLTEGNAVKLEGTLEKAGALGTSGGTIMNHEWVDLGLPSGTKWATTNVGAVKPMDKGIAFRSGTPDNKAERSKVYGSNVWHISGYSEYDPATAKWGSVWASPTKRQFEELLDKCQWKWETVNGIGGYTVIGPNHNRIFLPTSGLYYGVNQLKYWTGDKSSQYNTYFFDASPSNNIDLITNFAEMSRCQDSDFAVVRPVIVSSGFNRDDFGYRHSDTDQSKKENHYVSVKLEDINNNINYIKDGYIEFVDLGLPSGLKWASVNFGATVPSGYGFYLNNDGINKLDKMSRLYNEVNKGTEVNGLNNWHIATPMEMKELMNLCTWTWTAMDGVPGYKVTGHNGNFIFLPAAGEIDKNKNGFVHLNSKGRCGLLTFDYPLYNVDSYYLNFDNANKEIYRVDMLNMYYPIRLVSE